jgi:hypothetical protein
LTFPLPYGIEKHTIQFMDGTLPPPPDDDDDDDDYYYYYMGIRFLEPVVRYRS